MRIHEREACADNIPQSMLLLSAPSHSPNLFANDSSQIPCLQRVHIVLIALLHGDRQPHAEQIKGKRWGPMRGACAPQGPASWDVWRAATKQPSTGVLPLHNARLGGDAEPNRTSIWRRRTGRPPQRAMDAASRCELNLVGVGRTDRLRNA